MLQAKNQSQQKVAHLSEVAVFLRKADKLVKEGQYNEALEQIQKARKHNPKNLYALAYEERVRSIIASQTGQDSDQRVQPTNDLEKISTRAIAEAQRSAEAENQKRLRLEQMKKEEEETRKREELQRNAIQKKVYNLLLKAREYHHKQEHKLALDEIARVHMIDPSNADATKLEEIVRSDQEKAAREAETERKRQQEEEERKRKEYVEAELQRIKDEGEEKKRKVEEARKKAQQEKIQKHIKRAQELCDEGSLDDALAELAFVVVIDPLNEEMIELEQRIRELEEEQQAAELERLEREKSRQEQARRETQEKIRAQIDSANNYIKKHQYSEALRVISSAYVVDPLSQDLQHAEEEILKARDEWMRLEEEKRQREEDERRRQQEEEMRQLIQNAKKQASESDGLRDEEKAHEKKKQIKMYLDSAREYLKDDQFENALGEIALAFIIDPFDEDISQLEEEIIQAQNIKRSESADGESEFGEDISQADQQHIEKAKELVAEEMFDEALAEIAMAKMIEGDRKDLDDLENYIWSLKKEKAESGSMEPVPGNNGKGKASGKKKEEKPLSPLQMHLRTAEEYAEKQEYAKALDEITQAYLIDPLNEEIEKLEEQIREMQEQK
jgi:hypothetical protein